MIYLFGIVGFILGFAAGLVVISLFLKGYSRRQLTGDKSLRWTYGFAVWVFAALGTYGGIWLYERSFF
jgi:undecaprenyl pyrophosphate phosphatase UppP